MDQRHLRGVPLAREHAFSEKGAVQGDAVEAADEALALPAFEAVGEAKLVKLHVQPLDGAVDPGLGAARACFGAGQDHLVEGAVGADLEEIGAHRAGQAAGHVERVQRNDAATLGIDQEDSGVLARVGHREDASGVAVQKVARVEVGHGRGG